MAETLRRELLANEGKAVYLVVRMLEPGGAVTQSYQLRAFPNNPTIRFEGRVHEQATYAVERLKISAVHLPIEIIHTGYQDAEALRGKLFRNRKIVEEQIAQDPDDLFAHYMLARTLDGLGEDEASAQWCARLLDHPKARMETREFILHAQALLAAYHCRRGAVDEGRRLLEELVARAPEFPLGRLLLGELAVKSGSLVEACHALLPILEDEPKPSLIPVDPGEVIYKANRYLGAALMGLGQWGEAGGCLERALELRPDDQEARLWLGESLLKGGRLDEAEKAFLACDGTNHPPFWLKLGTIALRRDDLDLAEERFKAAAAVGLDSAQLYNNFGLLMARQGRWEEVERNYGLALERQPDMMESLLNMGHGLMSQGRWREVEGFFLRALAHEPELLDARLAAAAFAFGKGEIGRARELADQLWRALAPDEQKDQPPPSDPSSLFLRLGPWLQDRGQGHLADLCDNLVSSITN